jgi:hypothetical protein
MTTPARPRRRHAWVVGGMGMECAATGEAGKYLGQAQWAMRRCLQMEEALLPSATHAFPLVLYEEVEGQGKDEGRGAPPPVAAAAAAAAAATTTTASGGGGGGGGGDDDGDDDDDYRRWPLAAAVPGFGRATRSPRGDLAVALETATDPHAAAGGVLILNPDATQLLVLPGGVRYSLPGLTDLATGARMPKAVRVRMKALHRVLKGMAV